MLAHRLSKLMPWILTGRFWLAPDISLVEGSGEYLHYPFGRPMLFLGLLSFQAFHTFSETNDYQLQFVSRCFQFFHPILSAPWTYLSNSFRSWPHIRYLGPPMFLFPIPGLTICQLPQTAIFLGPNIVFFESIPRVLRVYQPWTPWSQCHGYVTPG